MTVNGKKLLWVDDDGEERFLSEKYNLEKKGWSITWAFTVHQAAEFLRKDSFNAVLLDQMLPAHAYEDEPNYLGGCALLYWLRGVGLLPATRDFDFIAEFTPLSGNQQIIVALVTAFYDDQVMSYVGKVPGPVVELVKKPINFAHLIACLDGSAEE